MKIGDRFKDKTTGKIYIIRMESDNNTLCLEGENGLGRRLTGKERALRGSEWVKLYLFEHTSQNLEPEIFFITKTVSLSLNDADLIIQPLHKT